MTDAETQQLAASLSRYYQQVEGMSGKQAAAQAVNDLLTGNWGYRAHNYDYPYLGTKEQQEQYNNAYWDSVANKSLIEKLFSSRPMDENEEYYRDQYNIQKYIQSTEWERQVGRPVMNFLPGGIGFVYNTTDTLQGSYALGEGIGQVYRDGEFKTDSVLKMVDGVLTLAPVVASNIIPKGNSSTVAGKETNLTSTQIKDVKAISAAEANKPHIDSGWNPPYDPSAQVRQFTTTSKIEGEFVRVYAEGVNNPQGSFLVRANEIRGMSPVQIQQHLALPTVPTHIVDVTIPPGTRMQTGKVAPQPNFGALKKGGTQYELLDRIPSSNFKNMRPLK